MLFNLPISLVLLLTFMLNPLCAFRKRRSRRLGGHYLTSFGYSIAIQRRVENRRDADPRPTRERSNHNRSQVNLQPDGSNRNRGETAVQIVGDEAVIRQVNDVQASTLHNPEISQSSQSSSNRRRNCIIL